MQQTPCRDVGSNCLPQAAMARTLLRTVDVPLKSTALAITATHLPHMNAKGYKGNHLCCCTRESPITEPQRSVAVACKSKVHAKSINPAARAVCQILERPRDCVCPVSAAVDQAHQGLFAAPACLSKVSAAQGLLALCDAHLPDVRPECRQSHQNRSCLKRGAVNQPHQGAVAHAAQLPAANGQDALGEGGFPGIQLDSLDACTTMVRARCPQLAGAAAGWVQGEGTPRLTAEQP